MPPAITPEIILNDNFELVSIKVLLSELVILAIPEAIPARIFKPPMTKESKTSCL